MAKRIMNPRAVATASSVIVKCKQPDKRLWREVFRTARLISHSIIVGDKGETSCEYHRRKVEIFFCDQVLNTYEE